MQKTFNIIFKKVGSCSYKAFAPSKKHPGEKPEWSHCPQIEYCSVSEFLTALKFETGEEKTLKVTIKKP